MHYSKYEEPIFKLPTYAGESDISELFDLLINWYNGQSDPVYAVISRSSSDYLYATEILAIRRLLREIQNIKEVTHEERYTANNYLRYLNDYIEKHEDEIYKEREENPKDDEDDDLCIECGKKQARTEEGLCYVCEWYLEDLEWKKHKQKYPDAKSDPVWQEYKKHRK
jgi:hypothetical protein